MAIDDETLIDFATTCSDTGLRLKAEITLHKKNPAAVALGKMKSDKKAASSRENGKLGGRPKRAV